MNKLSKTLLITTSISLLTSCNPSINFEETNRISKDDFFKQSEVSYGIYYYSETCPSCKDTNPYILKYLNKTYKNNENYNLKNIYYLNFMSDELERLENTGSNAYQTLKDKCIGATDVKDVYQIGYPILYIVDSKENTKYLSEIYIGHKEITNYIKSIL